jgi:hypothetical protein
VPIAHPGLRIAKWSSGQVVPTLTRRTSPLVLEVAVVPDTTFQP